jgi:membrane protein implicated in regulation of membrane protease activity
VSSLVFAFLVGVVLVVLVGVFVFLTADLAGNAGVSGRSWPIAYAVAGLAVLVVLAFRLWFWRRARQSALGVPFRTSAYSGQRKRHNGK